MPKRSPMAALVGAVERPQVPIEFDATDMALLRALTRDSRQSQRALAREVSMSAPAVAERIARFERLGVIRSYTIDVDWDRLGFDQVVYMPITLASGADLEPTLQALRQIPELEELSVVTGQFDLIARFRLSGQSHLRELLLDRLWQIPGVLRFETMLGLGSLVPDDFTARMLGVMAPELTGAADAEDDDEDDEDEPEPAEAS